jgi:hypothetical protein
MPHHAFHVSEGLKTWLHCAHSWYGGAQDLGCGDADYVSRLLSRASLPLLRSYTGVDLSRPALEVARGNLARQAPGIELRYSCVRRDSSWAVPCVRQPLGVEAPQGCADCAGLFLMRLYGESASRRRAWRSAELLS